MNTLQIYLDILLNWQNLIDITLIAGGLFFLYRTLVRLGTWKILAGMLMAFMVYVMARLLDLEGIEWIFKNVGHVALLALIVIFQPEIRKIFEKVVSLSVTRGKIPESIGAGIISESLWALAQQKRGAIVVFPGKEPIQDKISGGYKLNAVPSKPLIMSIFDPNSPGHDGAVLIMRGQLTDFGVRLPMSSSSRLSEEFGTRHHAAMGMAEASDSLVLLVSEERGHVMAFTDGHMKRLQSPKEIVAEIEAHEERFDIKQVTQNVTLSRRTLLQLTGSLLIAMVFWSTLIVGEKQVVERTLTIPLEYTSPAEGLVFVGNRQNELLAHVVGPKSTLDDFGLSRPKAVVDLSSMAAGDQRILVSTELIKHPRELTILDISPAEINISLANITRQKIKVVPQLIGQLPNGTKLKNIEVIPKEIEIYGPPLKGENKNLHVTTTPIYLSSIDTTSRLACKIVAPPSLQPVDKRWPDVEVIINVIQR